ncbi:MAG TPA: Holliday junction resolvase RuvX [Acidisarcina sp.]
MAPVPVSPSTPCSGKVPRLLGLDVGDRRVGVAVSDAMGMTAQPVLTLTRTSRRNDLKSLGRIIRKYECTAVVVGNPLYMSGDLSPQAVKAQAFAKIVAEETGLPVHLWDERLTTTEAHRHLHAAGRPGSDHKQVIDQVAAVLILQGYLDSLANRRAGDVMEDDAGKE